ncbi:MAG: hypothetical protein JWO91_1100 [Acidobacteriaceae bacterium]|nr:hypothetical protein [Acidobacteriaceae bacterium]
MATLVYVEIRARPQRRISGFEQSNVVGCYTFSGVIGRRKNPDCVRLTHRERAVPFCAVGIFRAQIEKKYCIPFESNIHPLKCGYQIFGGEQVGKAVKKAHGSVKNSGLLETSHIFLEERRFGCIAPGPSQHRSRDVNTGELIATLHEVLSEEAGAAAELKNLSRRSKRIQQDFLQHWKYALFELLGEMSFIDFGKFVILCHDTAYDAERKRKDMSPAVHKLLAGVPDSRKSVANQSSTFRFADNSQEPNCNTSSQALRQFISTNCGRFRPELGRLESPSRPSS